MKTRDSFDSKLPPEIEAAALHWFGLRDAGAMTPAQEREFEAWLAADARHRRSYTELDSMWDKFGTLRDLAGAVPDPDLVKPIGWWSSWRSNPWPAAMAAAAAILLTVALWRPWEPAVLTEVAMTAVGSLRTMNLPDGSVILLNTDTQVEVNYLPTERRVTLLKGEAHFTVAKNKDRPFIVTADKVDVRAVGTAFNVRLKSAAVEVLVTEGKVRVDDAQGRSLLPASPDLVAKKATPVLGAGEKVVVDLVSARPVPMVASLAGAEMDRALAWQKETLEFEDVPLSEVVAEFNRYNIHQLVIADESLGRRQFGGKFRPGGYDALVQMLERSFEVRVERLRDRTVLHSRE